MNSLLPKSEGDFSEKFYWENFFQVRSNSFEWYGEYLSLIDLFVKYVQIKDRVLVVGCGNSTLSEDLYLIHKCNNVISIDTSNTAINQMLIKNKEYIIPLGSNNNKTFDFLCMDAANISCYENINSVLSLSCIIDKGTTDAIHSGGSSSTIVIEAMWSAIEHSLGLMGRYILITLAQEHIVKSVIKYFTNNKKSHGWMINVHELSQSSDGTDNFKLPIFAFVFYKMKFSESLPLVYVEENSFSGNGNKSQKRLLKNPKVELGQWIMSRQHLSMLCNTIKKSNKNESVINMVSPSTGLIRYHCVLVHNTTINKRQKKATINTPYCIFIIPFGHASSIMYEGEKQRLSICNDHIKCRQCLFVYLNQREYYASKQIIQDELHSLSLKFCPPETPRDYSIPVISSSDEVCAISSSQISQIIIETVNIDNGDSNTRRLIAPLLSKPVLMSEAPLSIKDIFLEMWISNVYDILSSINMKSLYLGRPGCTRVLDQRWNIAASEDILKETVTFSVQTFEVCNLEDINKFSYGCVICDTTMDPEHFNIFKQLLEKTEITILCSSDAIISNDILHLVRYHCQATESFLQERTYFWILSQTNIDISLFERSCKKL